MEPVHGYIATFRGQPNTAIFSTSLYAAKLKAIEHFKAPKSKQWLVSVDLAELNVNFTK